MITPAPLEALWRRRLDAVARAWPRLRRGNAEALHRARVASRRIREALPIVAADADRARLRKLRRRVREVTRLLGPVRQLDVQLAALAEVERETPSLRAAAGLVREDLSARRDAERERMLGRAEAVDVRRLMRGLARVGAAGSPDSTGRGRGLTAWRNSLAARTARRSGRLREAIDRAGSLYAPNRLHAVRIAAKKLRYILEVTDEAGIPGAGALIRPLKNVQGTLGRLHDLQVLVDDAREVEASERTDAERAGLGAFAQLLEQECRRLHAEYLARREDVLSVCGRARLQLSGQIAVGRPSAAHVAQARTGPRAAGPATGASRRGAVGRGQAAVGPGGLRG